MWDAGKHLLIIFMPISLMIFGGLGIFALPPKLFLTQRYGNAEYKRFFVYLVQVKLVN
jgi:hypothetical protein